MSYNIVTLLFALLFIANDVCCIKPGSEQLERHLLTKRKEIKAQRTRSRTTDVYLADYEARVAEYVQQQSKHYGVAVDWYDMYGERPELVENPDYHQYKIGVHVQNEFFDNNATEDVTKPGYTYTQWFTNGGTESVTSVFEKTTEQENTFTWDLEAGVKLKTDVTITCKVPILFEYNSKYTAELGVNLAATKTETEAESYTVYNTLVVPAQTKLKAEFIIEERRAVVPWDADILIDGWIAIWFQDKVDGHWLWFHEVFLTANDQFPLYETGVRVPAKGNFVGSKGVDHYLTIEEFPLDADEDKVPVKKVRIPPQ